jgi:hypothetical protein
VDNLKQLIPSLLDCLGPQTGISCPRSGAAIHRKSQYSFYSGDLPINLGWRGFLGKPCSAAHQFTLLAGAPRKIDLAEIGPL